MIRKFITVVLILFFVETLTGTEKTESTKKERNHIIQVITQYEDFIIRTMEEWDAPGAAIGIVKDDKIVYIKGFGVREIGHSDKINIHTVFRIASVSKGFAAVATGLLVEDGLLRWDDKVLRYLPDFSLRNSNHTRTLSIRHILSHTSGLPPHTYTNLLEDNVPYLQIIKRLKEVKLVAPPGKYYTYQNVLYSIIGDIIYSVTGIKYKDLVTRRIFEPLKMVDASLGKTAFVTSPNRAKPHVRRNFCWRSTEVKDAYYAVLPSAGVNASILDMARWLRAMMGGEPGVIPRHLIQEVTKPIAYTPQELRKYRWRKRLKNAHYGLGWRIYSYAGKKLIYHGGWVEGFRAEIGFLPVEKVGIVALVNCESLMANLLLPEFFDIYLN